MSHLSYRSIPAYGHSAIRAFGYNVSSLKNMSARHYKILLLVRITEDSNVIHAPIFHCSYYSVPPLYLMGSSPSHATMTSFLILSSTLLSGTPMPSSVFIQKRHCTYLTTLSGLLGFFSGSSSRMSVPSILLDSFPQKKPLETVLASQNAEFG